MNWREFKEAVEDQARWLGIDPDAYEVEDDRVAPPFDLAPDVDIHAQVIWLACR